MRVTKREQDGIAVVSIGGRLDANSAPRAEQELSEIASQDGVKILLDMKGLEYISSAGLRVLLIVAKQLKSKSGSLCLSAPVEAVHNVFEISGFLRVFTVKNTEEEALTFLAG